ncbi:MAG: radical SAM protein, partial [archaeon]
MKMAVLNIISYCNQDCIFCSGNTGVSHIASYNFIKKLLNKLKNKGVEEVVFTGGEVTLRPDIIEILRYS